jgi:hypothetical protein
MPQYSRSTLNFKECFQLQACSPNYVLLLQRSQQCGRDIYISVYWNKGEERDNRVHRTQHEGIQIPHKAIQNKWSRPLSKLQPETEGSKQEEQQREIYKAFCVANNQYQFLIKLCLLHDTTLCNTYNCKILLLHPFLLTCSIKLENKCVLSVLPEYKRLSCVLAWLS